MTATESYTTHIGLLNEQLAALRKRRNLVATARLLVIVLIGGTAWWLYPVSFLLTAVLVVALSAVFTRLVLLAADNKAAMAHVNRLVDINRQELAIAAGQYTTLPDGAGTASATHDYAHDLDIFGRASLYQYINRTSSQQGHATLCRWLLQPASPNAIAERQAAARELAPGFRWRQELQAYGIEEPVTIATEQKVTAWLQEENTFSHNTGWKLLRWLYPVLTLGFLALYIADVVPPQAFYGSLVLLLAVSSAVSKQITDHYRTLDKIMKEIAVLSRSAAWIEKAAFRDSYLTRLQQHFRANNLPASAAIKKLKDILDRFDYRLNPLVFIPLNAFLLWDLQLIFQLEKWRVVNKPHAGQWFMALGETEALATIANLHFNHPEWVFPTLDATQHGTLEATNLGHPLIPAARRVSSSFYTSGTAKLALVTGSNMAGKSTFLRSVGVNVVLAMMGAPVCASQMRVSPMRIISTMRVADNLEESTSTFYAELKKLKYIIESVNRQENVFLLLDEILRGTNSLDRHTGSRALVKQLIQHNATGILATHDLELAKLQSDYPLNIHNYHFDAQIAGDELYFDYQLKEGVCQSLNASLLMKKIGIEL